MQLTSALLPYYPCIVDDLALPLAPPSRSGSAARHGSLRSEFHHFYDALAIVLGEVDAFAVCGNTQAWLESNRVFVQRENRREAPGSKVVEVDCRMRFSIGIEKIEAGR